MGHWGTPNVTETQRKLKNGDVEVRTVIKVPYHAGHDSIEPDYSDATIEYWDTVEDCTVIIPKEKCHA